MRHSRSAKSIIYAVLIALILACGSTPTPFPTYEFPTFPPLDPGSGSDSVSSCPSASQFRTEGCDEIKSWNTTVLRNSVFVLPPDWQPFLANDSVSTDGTGEAELNLSSCYPGRLYMFRDSTSTFHVTTCRRQELQGGANSCLEYGSSYNNCPGELTVSTSNARIIKSGTVFSVTYLPDLDLSLVILLEGQAQVQPVVEYTSPATYGDPIQVDASQFTFVSPVQVAGLQPGIVYSLDQLLPVVTELNITDWMRDLSFQARADAVLPAAWPQALGGDAPPLAYMVSLGGGAFNDAQVQEAMLYGVDWRSAAASLTTAGQSFTINVNGQPFDINSVLYDPEQARSLLANTQYPAGTFTITLIYSLDQREIAEPANVILQNLEGVGVKVNIEATKPENFTEIVTTRIAQGETVMVIGR